MMVLVGLLLQSSMLTRDNIEGSARQLPFNYCGAIAELDFAVWVF
jgi:hypothetical protein